MSKKIAGLGLPLFFISPVSGFLLALFNIRSKLSGFIYVAFSMVFGYAMAFSDTSADSYRYAEAFSRFDNTLDYNTIAKLYQNGELRDIYRVLLFYITSIFSNNPKILFAFAGLIFGIFSYLNINIIVKERGQNQNLYLFILVLIFFTICSFVGINSFRFNTGAMLFFYSVYNCVTKRNMKWVVGVLVTPLFHYGFMLMIPVMFFYLFIERFLHNWKGINKILYYVFFIAFTASWILGTNSINLGFLTKSDALSGAIGSRIDYVNSENIANLVETRRDSSLFLSVQKYFDIGIKVYVFIVINFIWRVLKKIEGDKSEFTRFFSFVLVFYAVAFIATSFPSGNRFFNIAHLFLLVFMTKFYTICKSGVYKRLILFSLPVFAFNIAFVNGLLPILILSPTFWYGNVFWIIIEGLDFFAY